MTEKPRRLPDGSAAELGSGACDHERQNRPRMKATEIIMDRTGAHYGVTWIAASLRRYAGSRRSFANSTIKMSRSGSERESATMIVPLDAALLASLSVPTART